MDKKEYIVNQLRKTYGKKYENYCITRIISLVNRLDLKFVTQQLFKRKGKDIALADLYFPQINLWIEIDEGHHLYQVGSDKQRIEEVIEENRISEKIKEKYDALKEVIYTEIEEPMRIPVYQGITIEMINDRIDEIVVEINNRIKNLGENFAPWITVNPNPDYYKSKGNITVLDNAKFKTINSIGELYNVKVPFNERMHGCFKVDNNIYCWCPTLKIFGFECENHIWENEISLDGEFIYEDSKKRKTNYLSEVLNQNQIRYVFTKYKDETSEIIYKFKGVFEIAKEETLRLNKRVWIKKSDKIDLTQYK